MNFEKKRILVTVKAYPNPSKKYTETVCTAGILIDENTWVRIYPVPFRDLEIDKKFKKYDIIEAEIKKSEEDPRPESYKINVDTIRVLGNLSSAKGWAKRKQYVLPLAAASMCEIQAKCDKDETSLGVFKPAIPMEFKWEPAAKEWKDGAEERYGQLQLFNPQKKVLEKIPYIFRYDYKCLNTPSCNGHRQMIVDWELGESFRSWLLTYKTEEKTLEMIRQKWQDQMFGPDKDAYLFVGNQHRFKTFMVLGVFWPPK